MYSLSTFEKEKLKNLKRSKYFWNSLPKRRYFQREQFATDLGLDISVRQVRCLMQACMTHHLYCECECNGCTREKHKAESWESYNKAREYQMKWLEGRMQKLEKTIAKHCKALNLFCLFQGDPRGATCRFKKTRFVENDLGYMDDRDSIGADVWNW